MMKRLLTGMTLAVMALVVSVVSYAAHHEGKKEGSMGNKELSKAICVWKAIVCLERSLLPKRKKG